MPSQIYTCEKKNVKNEKEDFYQNEIMKNSNLMQLYAYYRCRLKFLIFLPRKKEE